MTRPGPENPFEQRYSREQVLKWAVRAGSVLAGSSAAATAASVLRASAPETDPNQGLIVYRDTRPVVPKQPDVHTSADLITALYLKEAPIFTGSGMCGNEIIRPAGHPELRVPLNNGLVVQWVIATFPDKGDTAASYYPDKILARANTATSIPSDILGLKVINKYWGKMRAPNPYSYYQQEGKEGALLAQARQQIYPLIYNSQVDSIIGIIPVTDTDPANTGLALEAIGRVFMVSQAEILNKGALDNNIIVHELLHTLGIPHDNRSNLSGYYSIMNEIAPYYLSFISKISAGYVCVGPYMLWIADSQNKFQGSGPTKP